MLLEVFKKCRCVERNTLCISSDRPKSFNGVLKFLMEQRSRRGPRGESENLGEAAMRVVVYRSMRVRSQRSVPYVNTHF